MDGVATASSSCAGRAMQVHTFAQGMYHCSVVLLLDLILKKNSFRFEILGVLGYQSRTPHHIAVKASPTRHNCRSRQTLLTDEVTQDKGLHITKLLLVVV